MSNDRDVLELVGIVVRGALGVTASALGETSGGLDLTLVQWRALVLAGDGSPRVGDVARGLRVRPEAASRLLLRLERRGFVTRQRDPADRRVVKVSLTPRGRAVRRSVVRARDRLIAQSLEGSGVTWTQEAIAGLERLAVVFGPFD